MDVCTSTSDLVFDSLLIRNVAEKPSSNQIEGQTMKEMLKNPQFNKLVRIL